MKFSIELSRQCSRTAAQQQQYREKKRASTLLIIATLPDCAHIQLNTNKKLWRGEKV